MPCGLTPMPTTLFVNCSFGNRKVSPKPTHAWQIKSASRAGSRDFELAFTEQNLISIKMVLEMTGGNYKGSILGKLKISDLCARV